MGCESLVGVTAPKRLEAERGKDSKRIRGIVNGPAQSERLQV